MTEEEKKAIKWLKLLVKTHKLKTKEITEDEILLNLIEKQQKEIKKYKESSEYNFEQYQDIGKMYFELKEKIENKIQDFKNEGKIHLNDYEEYKYQEEINLLEEIIKEGKKK